MAAKKQNRLHRFLLFLLLAVPLGYLFVTSTIEISLLSALLLSALYLAMRPFTVSVKASVAILVSYLAFSGLLNFSQPLMVDSWSVFSVILIISSLLQPLIFLLTLDALLGMLDRSRLSSDMVVIVLLWVSTLAVAFGSTALLHTTVGEVSVIFVAFLIPWLINGFVFLAAALVLAMAFGKRRRLARKKR